MADIILKNAQGVDETLTGVTSLVVPKSGGGTVTFSVAASPPATPTDAVLFYSLKPFKLYVYDKKKHWNGTLYYSTNHSSWSTWTGTTDISASQSDGYYKLYIRGLNNTQITGIASKNREFRWVLAGSAITCVGNINKLLSYSSDITQLTASYTFAYLFYSCGNVDFNVTLPATTLADYCYYYMFASCISLKTPPVLPATTLATNCYYYMFAGCTALTTMPALPVTTLANYCYTYMFLNCTSIKLSTTQTGEYQTPYRIPTSGTGTTATGAFENMFTNTGGTFTGQPTINTTYYTSNDVIMNVSVYDPDTYSIYCTFSVIYGTTWTTFVNSSANTQGFYISSGIVYLSNQGRVRDRNGTNVSPTAAITDDVFYAGDAPI